MRNRSLTLFGTAIQMRMIRVPGLEHDTCAAPEKPQTLQARACVTHEMPVHTYPTPKVACSFTQEAAHACSTVCTLLSSFGVLTKRTTHPCVSANPQV